MSKKTRSTAKAKSGRQKGSGGTLFGVAIADPVVRPTNTTVAAIRKAVKAALQKSH
jgi:hypothetical protein